MIISARSLSVCLVMIGCNVFAQIPVTGSLRVHGDSVRYTFTANNSSSRLVFSQLDSVNKFNAPKEYEGKQSSFIFESGQQQLTASHQNGKVPFQRISLTDGNKTKYVQVNFFGALKAHYAVGYQSANKNRVSYEIPEVYELVNIAIALTEVGQKDGNMVASNSEYASQIRKHFAAHSKHPLILRLNERLKKDGYNFYYGVRENAYTMAFDPVGKLVHTGIYENMWPGVNDVAEYSQQWESFAAKSAFRAFYQDHHAFYNSDIAAVKALLPVEKMQQWLQAQFPGIRYDSQKIVFSPLIGGAHSAQKFSDHGFTESLMFICDSKIFDSKKYTPEQIQGLYTGIVFTEIDHNFVNPTSDKYLAEINSAFADRGRWVKQGQATDYGSPYEVFNEYMTHAVHLLYIKDSFAPAVFELVRAERVKLNSSQRGFYQFEQFYNALESQYQKRENQPVADLFPKILAWSKDFKQ